MFFRCKKDCSETKSYALIVYQNTYATDYIFRNAFTIADAKTKPIIRLEHLKSNFRTPYNGYLTIKAKYSEIYFEDNSFIIVQGNLERFYLDKDKSIRIYNPKDLRYAYYEYE